MHFKCSFRHISSILCLDRSKKEEQIKWKLSGTGDEFDLTKEQKTSCQHYATIDDDYINVFDNGNKNGESRICSYKIDDENKELTDFCEYKIDGKFSIACGDAQKLYDETYMIGWGYATKDAVCMSVYDFSADKELLSVELKNPKNVTYRCVYYE